MGFKHEFYRDVRELASCCNNLNCDSCKTYWTPNRLQNELIDDLYYDLCNP